MSARILLAAAALAMAGAEAASAQQPPDAMELKCEASPTKNRPAIRLEGKAPTLPPRARLKIYLMRIEERAIAQHLSTAGSVFHSQILEVDRNRKIIYSCNGVNPGYYRAVVELAAEHQGLRSQEELKKAGTAMPQTWTFDYAAWGDDVAGRLGDALRELDTLINEATTLVGAFAECSANRVLWEANARRLDAASDKLSRDIQNSEAMRLYPAATSNVNAVVDAARSNAQYFTFAADGKFDKIVDYHSSGKPTMFDKKEFGWDVLRESLEEASEIGGREMALWVVKDTRRNEGRLTDALVRAVKEQAGHPGVSKYVNRLQEGGDRLEELEKLIREKK